LNNHHETEIKLRVPSLQGARALLRKNGFAIRRARVFEANLVYDTPDLTLRVSRRLLRLRQVGKTFLLTFKGEPLPGVHKSREEIETAVADGMRFDEILDRLGYHVTFRYEKYRTEFSRPREPGHVTLDETPIGLFLELEGPAAWIDRTAKRLGFEREDYNLQSYGALYLEHCRQSGVTPTHMVFPKAKTRPAGRG
jgi:adenylate cyclase class 2